MKQALEIKGQKMIDGVMHTTVTLMCIDCKGLGTLGGSSYVTESCHVCKGTGRITRDVT